jgi:hypothetical protein
MSVAIEAQPIDYSCLNNRLLYEVYDSTNYNALNFKYICDVYVGGILRTTLKVFPKPSDGRGTFDIGRIARNYINLQFNPHRDFVAQEFSEYEAYVMVQAKFRYEIDGEEYLATVDSNNVHIYNNYLTNDVHNRATQLTDYLGSIISTRGYDNTHITNGAANFHSFLPNTGSSDFEAEIIAYLSDGSTQWSETQVITPIDIYGYTILDISPAGINSLFTNQIDSNTSYYTVRASTSTILVRLLCEAIYKPYTIHFLNRFGGFDSMEFSKLSRNTTTLERKGYQQNEYRGGGIFETSNGVGYESKTTFATTFTEKLKLSTDILNDEGYVWLKELVLSPIVYIEDNAGYKLPVTIIATDYDVKKVVNDRCTALQIEVEYSPLNTQYR